jgi:prepilin-type N-terminal cleavage/methylation domain-containing protein
MFGPPKITESRCPGRDASGSSATSHHLRCASGFSLIEMMIVVSIVLILGSLGFVLGANIARTIRLRGSSTVYANLLQTARIRAVQDDRYYSVVSVPAASPPMAFLDLNGNGLYDQGEPRIVFAQGVNVQPYASGPSVSNLKAQFLPSSLTAQASVNSAIPPTFGPRGLPCAPSAGACPYLPPTSFITFLQNAENGRWEAITVTPAGRVNLWMYDGTSSWSSLN